MASIKNQYCIQFSNKIKQLENRYKFGEEYHKIQNELTIITREFVKLVYRFEIGDVIFDGKNYFLISDYAFYPALGGYDFGLNSISFLEIIENEFQRFHDLFNENKKIFLYKSLGAKSSERETFKHEDEEIESYLALQYDFSLKKIISTRRQMIHVATNTFYRKIHHIDFNIVRKRDSQDLYFLRDSKGSIKIGISKDVLNRVLELELAMNDHIEIIKVISNASKFERILHRKFTHLRENREIQVDGYTEWFSSHIELINFIEGFNPIID